MNKNDIQFNRDPIGHKALLKSGKQNANATTTNQQLFHGPNYIPTPSTYLSAPSKLINMPQNYNLPSLATLERIDLGCKEYFFGLPIPGGNRKNTRPSFTYITHAKVCQLEKDHVPLICKMVNEYFEPFYKLDPTTKKFVLHQFFVKYHMLECIYQTYRMDAFLPKNSYIVFNGYILDENDKGAIVSHAPIRHEVLQSLANMLKHTAACKKSIERLEIDDLEKAAMAGVLIWQEVASAAPLWSEATEAQEKILSELHAHALQKVGIAKAGSRIGALMSIINEVEAIARVFLERETMEKVFDSKFVDTWETVEPYIFFFEFV
uniref:NR LBD domain-containing protein n=1 Tax=Panagrellus redivivus TaxID=6233 RepID=A0A7E4W344_PANRE